MALTRITQGVIKPNENYDTHNINSTGIVTATALNISGDASIGGVLTYEDVTNIDSIGIITARSEIKVGTGVTLTSAGAGFYAGIVTASSFKLPDGSNVGGIESDSASNTVGGTDAGGAGGPDPNYASYNSFFGALSGNSIGNGDANTCIGYKSGEYITSGQYNTSVGFQSLYRVVQGDKNTAIGNNSLKFLGGSANENVAIGYEAAGVMSGGHQNVAIGALALGNSSGNAIGNVAIGYDALKKGGNTTCNYNIAIGHKVKRVEGDNSTIAVTSGMVAIGRSAAYDIKGATNSIFIGDGAGATMTISPGGTYGNSVNTNCIVIGANANPSDNQTNNEITLGDTNITKFRIPGIGVTFATSGNHITGVTTFSGGRLTLKSDVVQSNGYHWYGFHGSNSYLDINASHWGLNVSSNLDAFIKANANGGTAGKVYLRAGSSGGSVYVNGPGGVELHHGGASDKKLETTSSGITVTGSVTDNKGDLRKIPLDTYNSSHTLVVQNAGETVYISSGGVTIPSGTFSQGDAVTIINNSGSDQTITCSAVTTYLAGDTSSKSSLTLKGRGMATFYFASSSEVYGSGAGLE